MLTRSTRVILALVFALAGFSVLQLAASSPASADDANCKLVNGVPFTTGSTSVSDGNYSLGGGVERPSKTVVFPTETCSWQQTSSLVWVLQLAQPVKVSGSAAVGDTTGLPACQDIENNVRACNVAKLGNSLEFFALLTCVAGVFVSGALWASGSRGQNPGQELTGKRGLVVCALAAFVIGAYPTLTTFFNDAAGQADNTGVTSATVVQLDGTGN